MIVHELSELVDGFLFGTPLTMIDESSRTSLVNSSWINLQALRRKMYPHVCITERYFRYTVNISKPFIVY